eukprot:6209270-Pleurochrysis_carterae.AAC.2
MALEGGRQSSGHLWEQSNTDFSKAMLSRSSGVKDFAIAYTNKYKTLFDQFATAYSKRFRSNISACVDKFIGLKGTRDRDVTDARTVTQSQEVYIEKDDG